MTPTREALELNDALMTLRLALGTPSESEAREQMRAVAARVRVEAARRTVRR